jgi:hypothetical protein
MAQAAIDMQRIEPMLEAGAEISHVNILVGCLIGFFGRELRRLALSDF